MKDNIILFNFQTFFGCWALLCKIYGLDLDLLAKLGLKHNSPKRKDDFVKNNACKLDSRNLKVRLGYKLLQVILQKQICWFLLVVVNWFYFHWGWPSSCLIGSSPKLLDSHKTLAVDSWMSLINLCKK